MGEQWILVADGAQAKIFAMASRTASLDLVETFDNPDARTHPRELLTDAPARVHDRFGPGRHSVDGSDAVKAEIAERFARQLAQRLEEGRQSGAYSGLVIMAGPRFLGYLRDAFSGPVRGLITAEVDKDLVREDPASIRAHLPGE